MLLYNAFTGHTLEADPDKFLRYECRDDVSVLWALYSSPLIATPISSVLFDF